MRSYNKQGTTEQCIQEGKLAVNCPVFPVGSGGDRVREG